MNKLTLSIVSLLFSSTFFARTYTQFSHYSVNEGLSEINVQCMFQDKKDQMWFGTFDGLNMFNGYNFKTYKTNPGQLFGLENYRINLIREDKYGYLWIITYDGRVYRFDPRTEKFMQVPQCLEEFKNYKNRLDMVYTLNDGSIWLSGKDAGCFKVQNSKENDDIKVWHFNEGNELLSSNMVNKIFQDKSKNIWLLTNNGLNLFKPNSIKPIQLFKEKNTGAFFSIINIGNYVWIGGDNGKLRYYDSLKGTFEVIATPFVSNIIDIKSINSNEIFILTDNSGFFIYNIKLQKFTSFTKSNGSGVKSNFFYSCYIDKLHNIWIESENPSVVYFEPAKQRINNFTIKSISSSPFGTLPNFFVVEDKFGNIWVHPRKGGFSRYNAATNSLDAFYNGPNSPDRKFSNMMHSAYSDRQGNLWLCPFSHGIEKVVFSQSPFNFYKPSPSEKTSASNEVRSIYQDKNNWLWIATKNGTVSVFNENKKLIGVLANDGRISKSNPLKALIYNITSDNNGTIWLGSKGNGLYKLENKGSFTNPLYKITNYKYNLNDLYSLSSNNVYSIVEDHFNRIWVATYGGGINLIENENGHIRFINYRNKLKNYPIGQCFQVRCLKEDSHGRMFVGTTGGLVAFQNNIKRPENILFYQNSHNPRDPKTISGNDVHAVLPAKNGKLYLAIFGGGIDVLDDEFDFKKKPEFKSYKVSDGAPSNIIFTLKEDSNGCIWFSTQTKIGKFNPNNNHFDTYLPPNETAYSFAEASVCQTRQGDLAYGTTEGFILFNPKAAVKSEYKPRIVFTNFQLFNKIIEVGVEDSPLKQVIDETNELKLSHKQNIFSIGFAALDYTNPQNIQYAYILDGFEKEWNYVHDQRIATYTNIPKGKYDFRVKSTNAEGVWVDNERSIIIIKQPSFWESFWGYLFYFIIFLGLAGLVIYILSTIYRLKTDVEVEHRVTNLKLRFFTDISHELRTPLTLIASPVENMLRTESLSEKLREQLIMVQRNTDRMLRLITQILDFRKIQNNKMKLQVEALQPGSFIKEICQNFSKLAEERKIKFEVVDESNNVTLWADKDKFEKIFYNLLSNAFKFTRPGNPIEVYIVDEKDTVSIIVKDSGMGMSKDRMKLLFNRFESLASSNVSFQEGTGIGLSLTKELVELHQAKIEVESEPGKGSSFKVIFLKGNTHFAFDNELVANDDVITTEVTMFNEFEANEEVDSVVNLGSLKPTILIAEDNNELRAFLKSILTVKYDILEAENGYQAFEIAKNSSPDMIITDVMMPEMTGLELAKAVKADINISHIPLVMLTAKTDMENKLEALQYGVDDYITKPFSSAYLEARIENLLKLRKQLQELHRVSLTTGVISLSKPNIVSQDDLFLQKLITYIEQNIDNLKLTIDDIVYNAGLSRSAFFKKLKSLTGLAPVEFLKEVRIQRAAQLIESGEYNFSQITYMIGMSDPRYFSYCFRQKFGMSPREYKDKCETEK